VGKIKLALAFLSSFQTLSAASLGLVASFDLDTLQSTSPEFTVQSAASSLAFGNDSLFATFSDGSLAQYTPGGVLLQKFDTLGGLYQFGSLTFSGGSLYGSVTVPATGSQIAHIAAFDSSGFTLDHNIATPSRANSVALGDANVFASFDDGSLAEYDANGTFLKGFGTFGGLFQFGSLVFSNSNLYGVLMGSGTGTEIVHIASFDVSGFSVSAEIPTSSAATGLAIINNNIYATFADGTISRYALNGDLLASVVVPGSTWSSLTVSDNTLYASGVLATPEPATFTLLCLGLCAFALFRTRH
jgi:hypothetical protein